jgi:hypothetical protein
MRGVPKLPKLPKLVGEVSRVELEKAESSTGTGVEPGKAEIPAV